MAVFFLRSNLTYADKTDLLRGRAPASASALRNFQIAPTYADSYVFLWGPGHPGLLEILATPLALNQLSVFSPHQDWLLQGDYLLDSVKSTCSSANKPYWANDTIASPWYDYNKLDLVLPPKTAVDWEIHLPQETRSAIFKSSYRGPIQTDEKGPALYTIYLIKNGKTDKTIGGGVPPGNHKWNPIEMDLSNLRGQTATLHIQTANSGPSVTFMHPTVSVDLNKPAIVPDHYGICPQNTELNPTFPVLDTTSKSVLLDTFSLVKGSGQLTPDSHWQFSSKDGQIEIRNQKPLAITLKDFSKICFTASASDQWAPRAVLIDLYIADTAKPYTAAVPLLGDNKVHSYSYDLKLLEMPVGAKLSGLTIRLEPNRSAEKDSLELSQLYFAR